ncbi:HEAT repeat domain-containing protein [Merismopedia glauca]|uniref:HEAT repeat domain-containing protein n=1 Tax=Merismopedia glauca CCAP 1448/3 TaxID=1296344 RepID=A0A2T1BZI5_9CYAN|nr:HEAT repeat domain-containing protein [Merismopedia glauca]PSB01436.1 hypothetical protein C7B64_18265 [Merismopedia glauca CCAP 1448/3]
MSLYIGITILAFDPIINLVIWVGIGVFILNICLLGLILGQRYRYLLIQRQEKIAHAHWMAILVASLAEIPPNLPPIKSRERLIVLTLWNQIYQTIRGEAHDQLDRLGYLLSIHQIARRFLESRQIDRLLLGISTLGNLQEKSAGEKLLKLVKHKNPYVSIAAATALVKINREQSCRLVSNLICDRLDWSLALVVEILSIEGNELLIVQLLNTMPKLTHEKLLRVFRALEVSQKHHLLPLIPQLLHQFANYEEIVSACLRVLAGYKNADHLPIIREYVHHSHASVRVQVANGLSQMGTAADEFRLISLLSDSEWWVRYRAAQGLARLPLMTLNRLEQIQLQQGDRYARDILTQVIAEIKLTSSP